MSVASSIIGGFIQAPTTIHRGSPPTWSNGRVTAGTSTDVLILAAIFPARNTDLVRDDEGRRRTDLIDIYAGSPLYSGTDAGQPADRLEWNGSTYEVEDVDVWPGGLYQAKARRKTATEGGP